MVSAHAARRWKDNAKSAKDKRHQAGQATESHDHWSYTWRLATGQEWGSDLDPGLSKAIAGLPGYSPEVSSLVDRLRIMCANIVPS